MDNNIFIARQPIYDKDLNVIAYELLYRDSTVNQAMFNDDSQASSELITNVFMHIGVDQITGSALAFINIPQDFILNQQRTPMFAEQTVLEILESVQPEPEDSTTGPDRAEVAGDAVTIRARRNRDAAAGTAEGAVLRDRIVADVDGISGIGDTT